MKPKVYNGRIYKIAKVAYEVDRAHREMLGDVLLPSWGDAEDWVRERAYESIQARLADPEASAQQLHVAWVNKALDEGWNYGTVYDRLKLQNPFIVQYDLLTASEWARDYLFAAVCKAMQGF